MYGRFGKSLRDIGIGNSHTKKKSLSQRMLQSNNSKLLSSSAKMEIMQLLEEWEEPDIKTNSASKLKIKDVLQFRQAVAMMDDTYPFTPGELWILTFVRAQDMSCSASDEHRVIYRQK